MTDHPTIEQVLLKAEEKLDQAGVYCGHGTDNSWDEACLLLLHALGLHRAEESILQQSMGPLEQRAFDDLISQRIEQKTPAAYLIGEADFAGLRFKVDHRVLVPRSPIAELIFKEFRPWIGAVPNLILDLCTGSGCIGIATAAVFPESQVVLSDLSEEALQVAVENVQRHKLQDRCQVLQSNLFARLSGQRFDLILSNPPYVDQRDLDEMPDEYRAEPLLGLAAGRDGLDLVRPMLAQAADHLNEGGHLIVEVGNSWEALEAAYPSVPFTWIEFEYGGEGVFILSKSELLEYADAFRYEPLAAYNPEL